MGEHTGMCVKLTVAGLFLTSREEDDPRGVHFKACARQAVIAIVDFLHFLLLDARDKVQLTIVMFTGVTQ